MTERQCRWCRTSGLLLAFDPGQSQRHHASQGFRLPTLVSNLSRGAMFPHALFLIPISRFRDIPFLPDHASLTSSVSGRHFGSGATVGGPASPSQQDQRVGNRRWLIVHVSQSTTLRGGGGVLECAAVSIRCDRQLASLVGGVVSGVSHQPSPRV